MWKGLIVGILGACLWIVALFTPLHTTVWFYVNRCPPRSVTPDCGYAFFAPILFGPPLGVLISVFLSHQIDHALARQARRNNHMVVFASAAAIYGSVLGVLWALSLLPHVIGGLPAPLALIGMDWVGPLPIVLWSLIGGAVHASLWKAPRPEIA